MQREHMHYETVLNLTGYLQLELIYFKIQRHFFAKTTLYLFFKKCFFYQRHNFTGDPKINEETSREAPLTFETQETNRKET